MSDTISLDCFRCSGSGQLTVVMTGMRAAPSVTNLDSGEAVVLRPARIETTGGFSFSVCDAFSADRVNAWHGQMASDPAKNEVDLSVVAGDRVFRGMVRWPKRQPEPTPSARRRRRKA